MNKWLKTSSWITIGLGGISIMWFVGNLIAYEYFRPRTVHFQELGPHADKISAFIILGLFMAIIFHLFSLLTVVYQIKVLRSDDTLRKATLIFGVISFMAVFGDIGLLSDIGKESAHGWDVSGEWLVLYLSLIPQILFYVLMFRSVMITLKTMQISGVSVETVRDENVFYAVHYTGLLCGSIGLILTTLKFTIFTTLQNLRFLVAFYNMFILTPYCLIIFFWLFMKRHEHLSNWYDEKQFQDISRAGFFTLLLSFPAMAILYIFNYSTPGGTATILWFPFYIHIVLVFFSGTTLYYRES